MHMQREGHDNDQSIVDVRQTKAINFNYKRLVIVAQHVRAPTYQHLGDSYTAGGERGEEMIAFV